MASIWAYTIISVLIISAISLIGVLTLALHTYRLKNLLVYLVSFAAGALLGDVFIHLLPELVEERGFTLAISLSVLTGIALSLIIEKFIHWRHCHMPMTHEHVHPYAIMNLVGDGVHNFLDGIIIGAAYLVSIPVGIATTIAVIFHEIPQEIADFGVLLHGGFEKKEALFLNFVTALTAVIGAVVALLLGTFVETITPYLVSISAGSFIYIAAADFIPELHKEVEPEKSIKQLFMFALGVAVMYALLYLG